MLEYHGSIGDDGSADEAARLLQRVRDALTALGATTEEIDATRYVITYTHTHTRARARTHTQQDARTALGPTTEEKDTTRYVVLLHTTLHPAPTTHTGESPVCLLCKAD